MTSVAWRCRTGSSIDSFHNDTILRGLRYDFSYFLTVFLHFESLCFSKIVTHQLKSTMETLSSTFIENFFIERQCWVLKDASDVSYSNGLKIPTQVVLEVDALPKHWRVKKFWRFLKLSCKIMTCDSFASPSLLFDVIFVCWFLFNSPVKNLLKFSLRCCNNLTTHFEKDFCVSGSTYRFHCLYQIYRNDLNKKASM